MFSRESNVCVEIKNILNYILIVVNYIPFNFLDKNTFFEILDCPFLFYFIFIRDLPPLVRNLRFLRSLV